MNKKGNWGRILLGVLLTLVLVGGFAVLNRPKTFTYRDRTLIAKRHVPVNKLNREAFSVDEQGRVYYEANGKSARMGIDVSSHQGDVNWKAVAGDGVEFAMIRVGFRGYAQGELNLDKKFEQNIRGALDAGLDVGVYFFSQAITPEEAQEEADFVLAAVEGYDLTCPVVFDWESMPKERHARTDGLDRDTLTQCARAFCDRIREQGLEPMIYLNRDMGYLTLRLEKLADLPIWLAEYDNAPEFYYAFRFWQYSNTGKVAGIKGKVDLNLDFYTVNP